MEDWKKKLKEIGQNIPKPKKKFFNKKFFNKFVDWFKKPQTNAESRKENKKSAIKWLHKQLEPAFRELKVELEKNVGECECNKTGELSRTLIVTVQGKPKFAYTLEVELKDNLITGHRLIKAGSYQNHICIPLKTTHISSVEVGYTRYFQQSITAVTKKNICDDFTYVFGSWLSPPPVD